MTLIETKGKNPMVFLKFKGLEKSQFDELVTILSDYGINASDGKITQRKTEKAHLDFAFFQSFAESVNKDSFIDAEEATYLNSALKLLLEGKSTNIKKAKRRINLIAKDACWMSPDGIQTGILGSVSWKLRYYAGPNVFLPGVTRAVEFGCPYIEEMEPLTRGLFFLPQNMPSHIRMAANSVVQLECTDGSASGVLIAPHYLLTASHVVNWVDEPTKLTMNVIHGNNSYPQEVGVIPLKGKGKYDAPDLALIYAPQLPADLPTIPRDDSNKFDNKLYILGYPDQEAPWDLLASYGELFRPDPDKRGALTTSAIALPGNSGGPVVNVKGSLVGIVVGNTPENKWNFAPLGGPVNNSNFLPVHPWGEQIAKLIEGHERQVQVQP